MKECGATAAETRLTRTQKEVTRLDPIVYVTMRFTIESDLLIPERDFNSSHIKTTARNVSVTTATTPTASCKEMMLYTCAISVMLTVAPKYAIVSTNWARTPMAKVPVRMRFLLLTSKKSIFAKKW